MRRRIAERPPVSRRPFLFCERLRVSKLVLCRHVDVHALDADPARAGEAIEYEVAGTAQDAHAQPDDLDLHPDLRVLVDPAARLDIELLARPEDLFEDVAVAVEPQRAASLAAGEGVDEEPGAAEEHVCDAL